MATLVVGVPREVKSDEHRVAVTPDGVRELAHHGIRVLVEAGAGVDSSIPDDEYRESGADVVSSASEAWAGADLVCKVKEPQSEEYVYLRPGLVLFTYLHLAAYPGVADALLDREVTGIAYETVQLPGGKLPLLAPMSEVAGRMAVQVGANILERHNGGRGILLGGVPGVQPGRVVVLGAGNVGWNAAWLAAGLGAEVSLLDRDLDRLRFVDQIEHGRITTLASNKGTLERTIAAADLVVGAVLVPGGRAPTLVTDEMVRAMKPGAVVVDVAIDQGGCIETSHETTHRDPIYRVHDVVHYAVGNIPAAVPHTSTHALTNATLPYLTELAVFGVEGAVERDPDTVRGVNTLGGAVTNRVVANVLGKPYVPLADAISSPVASR